MTIEEYTQDEKQAILSYELVPENDVIADRFQAEFVAMTRVDVPEFHQQINRFGGSCLDIGSSYGAQYFSMKANCPNVTWYGCELAPQFVERFRLRLSEGETPTVYEVESYLNLPFEDNSFDTVTARSFLQHYSPEHGFACIDEMLRVASKAVIIKLKVEPMLNEDAYNTITGVNAGKGYGVEWAKAKWDNYLSGKKATYITPRLIVIEK